MDNIKKKWLATYFSVCFLILWSISNCHADDEFVFRSLTWGMSADDVRISEEKENDSQLVSDKETILTYNMNIYDTETEVAFFFSTEGLDSISIAARSPADLKSSVKAFMNLFETRYEKAKWSKQFALSGAWLTSNTYILLTALRKDGDEFVLITFMKPDLVRF